MPLIVEGGRVPPRWASEGTCRRGGADCGSPAGHLNIALINNMPDAALEDTELQFFDLLDDASDDVPVYLKLYSLAGIPRTDRGQRHLNSYYYSLDELWQNEFDGVIVTGTEPREPDLRDEPYWKLLGRVFDWAERNTTGAILSCLAAHASVLHADGIVRHRLPDKQFGVFELTKSAVHPLMNSAGENVCFPHSRWNEVRADELLQAGYTVLTVSADGAVDTFVKKKQRSLFLHFQGHPEYGAETLLKEYRRDIRRFINRERETYPTMPRGYFDPTGEKLLSEFCEMALANPREGLMDGFPDRELAARLHKCWHSSATAIYREWLDYLRSMRADVSKVSPVNAVPFDNQEKRSATQ